MNSFIPWIGGKKLLSNTIVEHFPKDYKRYVEVFGGAGWVLFKKTYDNNQIEIFNDINNNLVTLYRCIKYHRDELKKELDGIFMARNIFDNFKLQLKDPGLTDIQRSARYLYLIKISFGAKRINFATSPKNINRSIEMFPEVQDRLRKVIIENLDYSNLIKLYDREDTLFYLDPPYHNTEKYYCNDGVKLFEESDHVQLADILYNIKGKFILSYNDDAYIRKLYDRYNILEISRYNNLSTNTKATYKELLIKNY